MALNPIYLVIAGVAFVSLIAVVLITYHIGKKSADAPSCPDCPVCPAGGDCPKCPTNGKCPDCPKCPKCPDPTNCPCPSCPSTASISKGIISYLDGAGIKDYLCQNKLADYYITHPEEWWKMVYDISSYGDQMKADLEKLCKKLT